MIPEPVLVPLLPSAGPCWWPRSWSGCHQLGQPWAVPSFIEQIGPQSRIQPKSDRPMYFQEQEKKIFLFPSILSQAVSKKISSSTGHGLPLLLCEAAMAFPWYLLIFFCCCCFSALATLTLIYISSLYQKFLLYIKEKSLKRSLQMPEPQKRWRNVA